MPSDIQCVLLQPKLQLAESGQQILVSQCYMQLTHLQALPQLL